MAAKSDANLPQGSLDLLVLQALEGGPKHGYQIARHLLDDLDDPPERFPALAHRLSQRDPH